MPRLIEHPRASFKNGLEVAASVDYIGGSCTIDICAEKMKKKVSGAFKGLISAGVKHGLVTMKKEVLSTTELYRTYKLAYDEKEKTETLRKAFLYPPLYQKIYERFKGKDLPVAMLDKILIREFGVEEVYASRVSGYFIDGAKASSILENGKLVDNIKVVLTEPTDDIPDDDETEIVNNGETQKKVIQQETLNINLSNANDTFTIAIVGPGMNTKIAINEEDDLLILEAMLNKIKKKLREGSK